MSREKYVACVAYVALMIVILDMCLHLSGIRLV
jgi:hypothetical protein